MNDYVNRIFELYDSYIEKVNELERNKKFTAGLLGLTKGPKDDPCHDEFIEDLKKKISEFASADPQSEDVYTLLKFMYEAPLEHKDNHLVYWMFMAAHTLSCDLCAFLTKEDAADLYKQFNAAYPRYERLPAQKNVLKALKKRM